MLDRVGVELRRGQNGKEIDKKWRLKKGEMIINRKKRSENEGVVPVTSFTLH